MASHGGPVTILAGVLNLLAPGAGLTLVGVLGWGVAVAVGFGLFLNGAIVATWLFPDEVPPLWQTLLFGVAGAIYLAAQVVLGQVLRGRRVAAAAAVRRGRLARVQDELERGAGEAAWEALQPLRRQAPDDLLVALLTAETLTCLGDARAAERAWARLGELDRHHLYREQIRSGRLRMGPDAGSG